MIRRSFRRGLTLGLLVGVAVTVVRAIQGRRTAAPSTEAPSWAPMPGTTPVVVPEPAPTASTEVHTGADAEAHFADASRQQPRPVSDWEPATPLPPAEETTPLTPPEIAEAPGEAAPTKAAPVKKTAAKKATKKATKKTAKKTESTPAAPWVEPVDGACPGTHPVKGKLSSRIFHVPGGFAYPRTRPDRCYVDPAAAEADGLRAAKR